MSKKTFNPIIQTTTNYTMFKFINGNRDVNQIHVRRLKESFQKKPLLSLIIVNEKYQIIDGQHRFQVHMELGLPINFVVAYGYGVSEVQTLNVNSSDWKKKDFLHGYIKKGNNDYIEFERFQKTYPKFNFTTCLKLLSGLRSSSTKSLGDGYKTISQSFEKGEFKIKNLKESHDRAKMLLDYEPYFAKFNDNSFVVAIMYLFEHKNYKHSEMISKLRFQPNSITSCKNQVQYLSLLEDIYNYHRREKVSFKY
jgi:hypothetical protein